MQVMDDQRTLSFRAMAGGVSEIPGGTPLMDPGCLWLQKSESFENQEI
jgi:hypothetical protein